MSDLRSYDCGIHGYVSTLAQQPRSCPVCSRLSDPRAALAAVLSQPGGRDALRELLTSEAAHLAAAKVVGDRERLSPTGIRALDTAEAALHAAVDALPSGRGPADRGEGAGEAGKGRP